MFPNFFKKKNKKKNKKKSQKQQKSKNKSEKASTSAKLLQSNVNVNKNKHKTSAFDAAVKQELGQQTVTKEKSKKKKKKKSDVGAESASPVDVTFQAMAAAEAVYWIGNAEQAKEAEERSKGWNFPARLLDKNNPKIADHITVLHNYFCRVCGSCAFQLFPSFPFPFHLSLSHPRLHAYVPLYV